MRDTQREHGYTDHAHSFHESIIHAHLRFTPGGCSSDVHIILRDNGKIRIEIKFDLALAEKVNVLLHQEFDVCIHIGLGTSRQVCVL
jgi:hypothetical protein